MAKKNAQCRRACQYRGDQSRGCNCDYMSVTGHSRLKAIYKILGVEELNPEELAEEPLVRPENCPVYEKRRRGQAKKKQRPIVLPGTRPKKEKTPRKAYNKGVFSFDTEKAKALYLQGLNDLQIGQGVGTGRPNIYHWRKVNGLKANSQKGATFSEEEAHSLYEDGLSDKKIGKALGVSDETIYKWRKRRGLPTKQTGRRKT